MSEELGRPMCRLLRAPMQGGILSRVVERILMLPTFQDKLLAHTSEECLFLGVLLNLHTSV